MSALPTVAVVVPTRNSGRTLGRCLRSIVIQSLAPVDVIVVDNRSQDDTVAIAGRSGVRVVDRGPERCAQRNHGWRLTTADAVFFVDSDMVLEPDVLASATSILAGEPSVGALVVPERAFGEGFLARCRALEKEIYLDNAAVEAARIFRREALAAVGGYDERLTACEDWDLADRVSAVGWRTARTEAYVWHDEGRVRLRDCFAKKRYYGRWYPQYLDTRRNDLPARVAHHRLGARQLALIGRSPVRAAGLAVMKTTELVAFALGSAQSRAWQST